MYNAEATEPKATEQTEKTANVVAEPTNEKTAEIDGKIDALFAAQDSETDRAKKLAISMEIYKLQQERAAEVNNIKKHQRELELKEAQNKRIQLVTDLLAAHEANLAVQANKKATEEEKTAANEAFVAAREIVQNELLAKYKTSSPAKTSADGGVNVPTSGKSAEIKTRLLDMVANGTPLATAKKMLVDEGFSRGTVGTVATVLIKAGEISA